MKEFKKCKPIPKGNSFEFKRVNSVVRTVIMDGRVLGDILSQSSENMFVVRNEFGVVSNGGSRIFFSELDAINALRDAHNDQIESVNKVFKGQRTKWVQVATPWAILITVLIGVGFIQAWLGWK